MENNPNIPFNNNTNNPQKPSWFGAYIRDGFLSFSLGAGSVLNRGWRNTCYCIGRLFGYIFLALALTLPLYYILDAIGRSDSASVNTTRKYDPADYYYRTE